MALAVAAGVNERDINPEKTDPAVPIAYNPANVMPAGDLTEPLPVERKAAVEAVRIIETPNEAKKRIANGGATPSHYRVSDSTS